MIARIVALLLLALNAAAAAWWYTRPPASAPVFRTTEEGVPALLLLEERDADAMSQAASLVQAEGLSPAARHCSSVGPFEDQSALRTAMAALTPQSLRIQFQETTIDIPRGYWVYLPAFADRDSALRSARQLNAAGVRDYYVVTAGDHENTISLGLFRERDNASRRQAQIAALGFPARLEERTEVQRRWWIELEREDASPPDLSGVPGAGSLTLRAIPCR
jgi:cell division septation protein DedD